MWIKTQNAIFCITFIATLAESLIVPFYPQFFKSAFGIDSPTFVGGYLTACRVVFMFSYPIWAIISKRTEIFRLLIFTQGTAGVISLYCAFAETLSAFYIASLSMLFFKTSYLLLYPYLLKLSSDKPATISRLAIIIHSGFTLAAILGGFLLENIQVTQVFIVIGLLDFFQMFISIFCNSQKQFISSTKNESIVSDKRDKHMVFLCLATFLLYLLLTIVRPFYTEFLEIRFPHIGLDQAGLIFIIPSVAALVFLPFSKKNLITFLIPACLFLPLTLIIQGYNSSLLFEIPARWLYGLSTFVMIVFIESMFFTQNNSGDTTIRYSYMHIMQNLAYLSAPVFSGLLVNHYGYSSTFYLSAAIALLVFPVILRLKIPNSILYRRDKRIMMDTIHAGNNS